MCSCVWWVERLSKCPTTWTWYSNQPTWSKLLQQLSVGVEWSTWTTSARLETIPWFILTAPGLYWIVTTFITCSTRSLMDCDNIYYLQHQVFTGDVDLLAAGQSTNLSQPGCCDVDLLAASQSWVELSRFTLSKYTNLLIYLLTTQNDVIFWKWRNKLTETLLSYL